MTVNSYRVYPSTLNNQNVLRIDTNGNHAADENEPILVRSQDGGWTPATNVDASIDRKTLAADFGFWTDKQISHKEGWWWDRKEVIDRPKDAQIQSDEVNLAEPERLPSNLGGYSNTFYLGSEIEKDGQGRVYLHERYERFGSHTIIGPRQIDYINGLIADDANWRVPSGQA